MTESKRILVVDDEPNVVTYLTTLLEDNGYATVSAGDGIEGLERAKADRPDLITLDITMPKESGVGLYRKLREDDELKAIKVVVVTAVTAYGGSSGDFEKFLKTRGKVPPPDGFVSKPVDKDDLLALIAKLL